MTYKGFTIEQIPGGPIGMMQWYDTEAGIDCDWTGDGWHTNVRTASSTEDAIEQIDEEIAVQEYKFQTKQKAK